MTHPIRLWRATLNPFGPNYGFLSPLFGPSSVPLKSPERSKADLGPDKDVDVYLLNLDALPLVQRSRLLWMIAQRFDVPLPAVTAASKGGFPIRAADVIVTFDMRAVV